MNDGHIAAVEVLEAPDDAAAIREATAIFLGRFGQYQSFEVWDQGRFIYRSLGGTSLDSPMTGTAVETLLEAYQEVIAALRARAKDCDADQAVECIHRANNLQAIVDGYERLNPRAKPDAGKP
jgi:hypothetical protein